MNTHRPIPAQTWQRAVLQRIAFFALTVLSASPCAALDAAAEAMLPDITPARLAAQVAAAIDGYRVGYIEATFLDQRNTNMFRQDQEPILVRFPGRFLFASDGRLWRAEYESMNTAMGERTLSPYSWVAGFDGQLHFKGQEPEGYVLGEQQGLPGISLPEIFWSSHGEGFSQSLASGEWNMQEQAVVDGYRCYVVHRERTFSSYRQRQELTISPRQGYLPVHYKVFADDNLSWSYELTDLRQASNGQWFPRRVRKVSTAFSQDFNARVTAYEPERDWGDDFFTFDLPLGVGVRDHGNGLVYRNDPWWPELRPQLRARFGWPPPDLSRLRDMVSYVDPALEGQQAPPLKVDRWLQGEPVELASRLGKVTLLHFSSGSLWNPNPGYVAALKGLYAAYQKLGLEIVGINTHKEDVTEDNWNLQELQIPWPVAVDSKGDESPHGKTFEVFALKTYASQVLVDPSGKLHLVQQGKLLEQIRELLKSAGAEQVPELAADGQREVGRFIKTAWSQLVREARKEATIRGQVTQAGEGLPGVEVTAQLRLEVANPRSTLATTLHRAPDQQRTMTGADGTFEITDLCKGVYLLSFRQAGHAREERRIIVPGHGSTVDVQIEMLEGDSIRGQLIDGAGQPVPAAEVRIRHRHFGVRGAERYGTYNAYPAVTDADGRFEFTDLMSGAYTIDVKHGEFQAASLERIPAGTTDAVLKLHRKAN